VDDLVTWLLTQVSTDEMEALAASPSPWRPNAEHDQVIAVDNIDVCDGFALSNNQLRATVDHIVAWDPTRVLAECAAKRQIIELAARVLDIENETVKDDDGVLFTQPIARRRMRDVLREYAAVYAKLDRPGYRAEWRPLPENPDQTDK
jgi:hypothetical protein